jgi:hypothetical protein
MPIRIAVVESRWLAGLGQQPGDGIADCDFDVLAHRGRRRLNDR